MSDFDELLSTLAAVVGQERLPEEVESNLRDQQITTKQRVLLLDDNDLKELGFVMGPRKLLLHWIRCENGPQTPNGSCSTPSRGTNSPASSASRSYSSTPSRTSSPVPSTSAQSTDSPVTATPVSAARAECHVRKFQNFRVDDLLRGKSTQKFDGAKLVERLQAGVMYCKEERSFLTKTVCRYLMAHCQTQDDPTMEEKVDMAQSIVNAFPVLKEAGTGGYGEFCDPKSHTGYINYYVRTVRSRSTDVTTRWTHPKKRRLDESVQPDDGDDVRNLRERRPNASNRVELLQLMDTTRDERRMWISSKKPSITEILQTYPRFQDIDTALKEEFASIVPNSKSLMAEFQPLKSKILTVAANSSPASTVLSVIDNDLDEDTKSEVAFKCLVVMLPAPPKRGVRTPKPLPTTCIGFFFNDCKDSTVEEAVVQLREAGCLQPCLFRVGTQCYIKADNTAIPLSSASCFTEAVEYLLMAFWVFNVEYPAPLRLFYQFVEGLLGVGTKKNSAVLRDLRRMLDHAE